MKQYQLINKEPVIRTYTGKWVNVFEPTPEMFCIEDIAHSLSNQCRFAGHTHFFYSVARHSLNCAHYCQIPELKLDCLMHDATEAYLQDIVRPIKKYFPEYNFLEDALFKTIATAFNLEYPMPKEVIRMDNIMLELEWDSIIIKRDTLFHPYINQDKQELLRNFRYFYFLKHNKHPANV